MTRLLLSVLLASMLPTAGFALTLADLTGAWRGEGSYRIGTEPERRLHCRMRGTAGARGTVILQGRCATAQAGQSFAWMLHDLGDGRIEATDRSPVDIRDDDLPDRLSGRLDAEGLRFATPEGGRFLLQAAPGGLMIILSGLEGGQPAQAEALLVPEG